MAVFSVYTFMFSPITEVQGELFPSGETLSMKEAHDRRHESMGKFFEGRGRFFSIAAGEREYACKMVLAQDGVVVFKIANNRKKEREVNFEVLAEPDQPSCYVIIDNREKGLQNICIQRTTRKAFTSTHTVARILEQALNAHLEPFRLRVGINAKYSTAQFWHTVETYPEGIKSVHFHMPYPNMAQISDLVDHWMNFARSTNSDTSLVLNGQNKEALTLSKEDLCLLNIVKACAASGRPISIVPRGQRRQIKIDQEQHVVLELQDAVLSGLDEVGKDLFQSTYPQFVQFLNSIKLVYE